MISRKEVTLDTVLIQKFRPLTSEYVSSTYCFAFGCGQLKYVSTINMTKKDFEVWASKKPKEIITYMFGLNEEAMSLLREAQTQGGIYYNSVFIKL